jgi:vitamin B12 transporter
VADALRDVAGADVVSTGSPGALTSLFMRGGESGYTKVLVDGVPLNEPGGVFYLQNLTTADVDRIEIVRGPSSVLYGSDAVTGVVQIFTRHGSRNPQGTVDLRGGSYKSAEGSATASGSLGPLGYSVGGDRESTSGTLPFNNQFTNGELAGRLEAGMGGPWTGALTARYHTADYHYPTVFDGTPVDHNQHRRDEGTSLAFNGSHRLAHAVDGHLLLAANSDDAANINPPDSPADTLGVFSTFNRDVFRRLLADAHVSGGAGDVVATVGGGLEGQVDRTRSLDAFNFGGIATSATGPNAYFRRVGDAYGQLAGNVGEIASYTLGARLDDNSAFGTYGTYRAAAGYNPGFGAGLHASIGTSFKEPTIEQNFSTAPSDSGNPKLRPERTLSWEIGISEAPLGPGFTVTATYFNQRFRNIVDYSFARFPVPGVPGDSTNYVNIAAASADGLEAGFEIGPVGGLTLNLAYTGLHTRVTSNGTDTTGYSQFRVGTRLIRRPSHQFSGGTTYAWGQRGSVAATVRFVGTRDDINFNALSGTTARVVLPGYTTVDLAAAYRLLTRGKGTLSLTARATNLLDRHYQEVYSYAAPGAIILGGVRVEW